VGKLDTLGKELVGRGKVDLHAKHPEDVWREDRILFLDYLARDVVTLRDVLVAFAKQSRGLGLLRTPGLPCTIGSMALKAWVAGWQPAEVVASLEGPVATFTRKCVSGGRVEVFRPGYHRGVRVYDINSLYPYAATVQPVPVTPAGFWCHDYQFGRVGVYKVAYSQKDRSAPAILCEGHQPTWEGEGYHCSPELDILVRGGGKIDVMSGYVFTDTATVLAPFFTTTYGQRLATAVPGERYVLKMIMNNLIGKFIQRPMRNGYAVLDAAEVLARIRKGEAVYPLGGNLYRLAAELPPYRLPGANPAWGALVLSRARAVLYPHLCNSGVIYTDTDSVHTTGAFAGTVGAGLGEWKVEHEGEGIYLGRKLYALRDAQHKVKMVAKGVSISGDLGARVRDKTGRMTGGRLNWAAFKRLLAGPIAVEYRSSPTFRDVIRGRAKPCQFIGVGSVRKRTLRITASLAMLGICQKSPKRPTPHPR
jgi:hypothetical protein